MRIFLDTSVLLAACASPDGASRAVFDLAVPSGWNLISAPYALQEAERNLKLFPAYATTCFESLRAGLHLHSDVLTLDRPSVFGPAKDRPILFSALAWADVLLTLDRGDFGGLMRDGFYGLRILKPGDFLQIERAMGRIVEGG